MPITQSELAQLVSQINAKLSAHKASFVMSVHFALDRVNDIRNTPPITLGELKSIFERLIAKHLTNILALNDNDTFNIRCTKTHINMPCAVKKDASATASITHKNIVITVMRKASFVAKDSIEFRV